MSAVFERLSRQFAVGFADRPPELSSEWTGDLTSEFRDAAVLVAMTEREDPGIYMIHRPSNMRAHPGQVAFPGGKLDPGEGPVDAALREAWEELGIPSGKVRVVGTGDPYRTRTGFEITPVLATVSPDIEINPNPTEVAQWFEAPVGHVLDPGNHEKKTVEFQGAPRSFYEILWQEHRIWGATAGMIVNLSRRLNWHG